MMQVSAYVPLRNDFHYLSKCLISLFQQTHPFHEVIVIDDASSDGLQEWARTQTEFNIIYIRLDEHKGLAAARNKAIEVCSSEFIAAIDADCVLNKEWLAILLRYIAKEDVAGVGGQLIEHTGNRTADLWRKEYLYQTRGVEKMCVNYLPGCNTLFRVQTLEDVAGYNEQYHFYHEDTDLGERVIKTGLKMLYVPDALAHHCRRDSLASLMRRCWGYRHREPITRARDLVFDLVREFCKGIKLFLNDLFAGRLGFSFKIDLFYFVCQSIYSCKAYAQKNNNF